MKNLKLILLVIATAFMSLSGIAQKAVSGSIHEIKFVVSDTTKPKKPSKKIPGTPAVKSAVSDTTKPEKPAKKSKKKANEPKPYAEVITDSAITSSGLFKVHKVEDDYFFEIPDSILGRDILVVNRLSKAAAGVRIGSMGYAGDQIGKSVIRFVKGPSDKIFLKSISYQEVSKDSSENGMFQSFTNSNIQPIEAAFDIKAFSPDSNGTVIDVTKYIDGDNDILFFDSRMKKAFHLSKLHSDRSYIKEIKSFPLNIEITTVKTFTMSSPPRPGSKSSGSSSPVTFELNSSLVLLPKVPMQPRYYDPRVGYFATSHIDFDANPQGVKRITMATRWRLEPKDEDIKKYKRGILVEPKKPIVFYIDPATPKKWVPYLIQGVNDWQAAFEQAGFKNAIIGKEAPVGDSTWSLEDARNSAIVYKPSAVANASGPHVHDPRSGEIIETHVNWYHNVMELVHNWYFIQAAAVDKRARKMEFDEELMGQLIRFVSSHEVGHTLGLRHNFGSSSTVPVENLRNNKWLDAHGHTPSIMDYARFNYVAQPEDNISHKNMYPRIGEYDKWAIEWGYKWLPQFNSAKAEEGYLNKLVSKKLAANPRLYFGTESDRDDPRNQNEDLGNNAMLASTYGIKNLKRILPNLLEWTKEPNEGYGNAKEMYDVLLKQFSQYMGHVAKNIGGKETTPSTVEQAKIVYEFVPEQTQKEAVDFLQKQLFTTPTWLLDKDLYSYAGEGTMQTISNLQNRVLRGIMNNNTISKLLQYEAFNPTKAYTVDELFTGLENGIWKELDTHETIDIYRRNLQKAYAAELLNLLQPLTSPDKDNRGASSEMLNDGLSIVKGHIKSLIAKINAAIPQVQDTSTILHLQDVMERLKNGLDPKG